MRAKTTVPSRFWPWARPLAGAALLTGLLWWVGTGPFLDGLRLVDGPAVTAALGIGALTTVCGAWRWRLVAEGLGVRLPLSAAVAHCYRAVFLNATLPGGVAGDVHRAVRHGRDAGDVRRGVRAVLWERTAGQLVMLVVAAVVLVALPSPVRPVLPVVLAGLLAVGLGLVLLARALPRSGASRWARAVRATTADVRAGLLRRRIWVGVLAASTVVVAGHLATFLVAARTAGSVAPLSRLLPLTLLALLAMAVPLNVGGFGPREGVAAWAFAAAGLTAAEGIATATVYGALTLVASLPGAAVLVSSRVGPRRRGVPRPGKGKQSVHNCHPAGRIRLPDASSASGAGRGHRASLPAAHDLDTRASQVAAARPGRASCRRTGSPCAAAR